MKLVSLSVLNIGPFASIAPLTFEPDVTVITGRNDAGKSSLLRLIEMVCGKSSNEAATEDDINFDYLASLKSKWDEDEGIICEAIFHTFQAGAVRAASYKSFLAPKKWNQSVIRIDGIGNYLGNEAAVHLPKVIRFRPGADEGVRQQLDLTSPNPTEQRFIGVAFGPSFNFEALQHLTPQKFQTSIARAQSTLNKRLNNLLPKTLNFQFQFTNSSDKRDLLFINLVDEHGCSTSLGQRGSGVQKMVDFLGRLAVENIGSEPVILLLDEPETSLHADAQHTLRRALEALGQKPNIQVIYATHSPCMVNTMRPKSLRLLKRVPHDESALTIMDIAPFAENYASIRAGLGMSPADSLLYAPITVIVEGKTERLALPILLKSICEEDVLSQTIIIEGGGAANIPNLCRIALAQGSKVICFFDGDQSKSWVSQFKKDFPKVPFVEMPEKQEFEDLAPRDMYFKALAKVFDVPEETINVSAFEDWLELANLKPQLSFSKRINRWLVDELNLREMEKHLVMEAAVLEVEKDYVSSNIPLTSLAKYMKEALSQFED